MPNSTRYALVTGASRGIGAACSIAIARMGYHVVINFRSGHDAANNVLDQIKKEGGQASLLPFDVTDRAAATKAIEEWLGAHGTIDILVNNAGIRRDNSMVWMSDEEWDDVIDSHLNGFYNVTRPFLKSMLLNKYGRIVNVVSVSGLSGMAGQSNYAAAKAGVIAATKSLAVEVAKRGITVNCVAPGFISTDMTAELDEQTLKKTIPMRRFGRAEEVANCVAFFASKSASYVTGTVLPVNGGIYM